MISEKKRFPVIFILTALIFVLIPFLFWRGTWFGTELTQSQLQQYLTDQDKPRKVQHALVQIERRMVNGDTSARRWYPEVLKLTGHPNKEVRITVAWVMGQDTSYAPFEQALLELVRDRHPMVRRNAALSLVRFGDLSGKSEILSTLRPYTVTTDSPGTLTVLAAPGDIREHGALLARIQNGQKVSDLTAPISGSVSDLFAHTGDVVTTGQKLLAMISDENQLWEALRAFYLVGTPEDLPAISRFATADYPERIQRQARETLKEIEKRKR